MDTGDNDSQSCGVTQLWHENEKCFDCVKKSVSTVSRKVSRLCQENVLKCVKESVDCVKKSYLFIVDSRVTSASYTLLC